MDGELTRCSHMRFGQGSSGPLTPRCMWGSKVGRRIEVRRVLDSLRRPRSVVGRHASARRPGPELVGVAHGPDVGDPVAYHVEREHRHGDAVSLSYQTGLAVD